ncbi:MAG: FAD-dependent oxidoreductase [Actinomycetota bacterium]|nr:FAD-dependent oxidoreductase [Actinomycetota bacterium]
MTEKLVVIGADAAGMTAASQARKLKSAEELEIVALERGNFTSYSACGIPYYVSGAIDDFDSLIVRTPEEFRDKQQIDARIRHEVTDVDLDRRVVMVTDLDGRRSYEEGFDQLLIATGSHPIRPPIPGIDAPGVFGVQTLDDGVAIDQAIEADEPRRAVVVGGGYIGLEMAEALVMKGLDVSLVELAPQPMPGLDPDMGEWVGRNVRDLGIELFTSEPLTGVETEGGRVSAVVTANHVLPADIVVLGIGARPNVDLSAKAGVPIGPSGGIAVDPKMRTRVDGVWAAGDCAEKFHRISLRPVAVALGTHANKEGRVAGLNLGGGYATFPGVVGTAVSKVCDLEVARTGLKESEVEEAGFDFVTAVVDSTTRAGYFPGAAPIKTKLIAERRSGRLLGAQIVGREGAAKRIDVLAAALWNDMTVVEILQLDLSYAPPFAPVWDPVLIAARKAWDEVQQETPPRID